VETTRLAVLINADSIRMRFLVYPRTPSEYMLDRVQVSSLITQQFVVRIVRMRTRTCIISVHREMS